MKYRYLKISFALGFIGLVLIIAIIWFATGSSGVAVYKAQLIAQGEKLTMAEIQTAYPQTGADFYGVARHLAELPFIPNVPHTSIDLMRFTGLGRAQPICQAKQLPLGRGITAPWETFHEEMRTRAAPLQAIQAILASPPDSGSASSPLLSLVDKRKAVQWLPAAVVHHLHEGSTDAALEFLIAIISAARRESPQDLLVEQMVRVAIANLAVPSSWEFLQATNLTLPQLLRLEQEWRRVHFLSGFERCLLLERAQGIAYFENQRGPGSQASRFWQAMLADADELHYLRNMQAMIASVRGGITNLSWTAMKAELEKAFPSESRWQKEIRSVRFPVAAAVTPNLLRALERTMKTQTDIALILAAIQVKRYQLEHGQPPASLPAPINDPMDGKPLRYKIHSPGLWSLYSVGTNGVDDGGLVGGKGGRFSDMWDAPDVLWPHAENTD